jgi:uncharacterized protein YbjQ (UPF0145 family)
MSAMVAAAGLSACAGIPHVATLSTEEMQSLTTAQRGQLSTMKVYQNYENPPNSPYKVIASVRGISCHRNTYQYKQVSDEEALETLKIRAALLNADAVIHVECQSSSGTDWVNNCWSSIVCIGDAIQSEPLAAPSRPIAVVPSTARPSLEYIPLPQPKATTSGIPGQSAREVVEGVGRGAGAGAVEGAVVGVQAGIYFAISTGGLGIIILPYSIAAGTAGGAAVGGALGATGAIIQNQPQSAPVPSRQMLTPVPLHLPVAEAAAMAAEIQPQLQAQLPAPLLGARCPVLPLPAKSQVASNVVAGGSADVASERQLKAQDFSRCIEVGITHLRWEEHRDQGGPYVVLLATARARMDDLASGKPLVTREYWFESARRYSWQPLLPELKRAQALLGERVGEDLLIDAIGDGVIENGVCGLAPAESRFQDTHAAASRQVMEISGRAPATHLNSQEPVLAWESFPTQRHLAVLTREGGGSATEVVYDLRIWREGEVGYVYEGLGLSGSTHRLDPVPAEGEYRWSVRARFVYAGKPRATTWNYAWEPALAGASANAKPPKGGWVSCRRDYISDASSFRLIVPSR